MKYFANCKTAEDVKQTYKRLVKMLHPDMHPECDTTAEFQRMQAEYTEAFETLKNVHVNADGETYEKQTDERPEEFAEMIERLLHLAGIDVELCGSWLWVTGNTKPVKDQLKSMGFKWASNKAAWYYHRDPWHRKTRKGGVSLAEIRMKYGSTSFTGDQAEPQSLPA